MISETSINTGQMVEVLYTLRCMINNKKIKRGCFPLVSKQIPSVVHEFQMIVKGLDQLLTAKQNQKNEQSNDVQNQVNIRLQNFVNLLTKCFTKTNTTPTELRQILKYSFTSKQNCDSFTDLIWEMMAKDKKLSLIEQTLKENNQLLDPVTAVSRLIDECKQNKEIIQAYEKMISQFTNLPSQIQPFSNMLTIQDEQRKFQIKNNCDRMLELLKAIRTIDKSFQKINIKMGKLNNSTWSSIKLKTNRGIDWAQRLVEPVSSILKQNKQLEKYKYQYDQLNKIVGDLDKYRSDKQIAKNMPQCDAVIQSNLKNSIGELQSSAKSVKNITRRMTNLLTQSKFMNESQLQQQAMQKSDSINALLTITQKRMTDVQSLCKFYEDFVLQIKKVETVKNQFQIDKNAKYTLAEEIGLVISGISSLQANGNKQINLLCVKQSKQNIQSGLPPITQNQQIKRFIQNWIFLCKTILPSKESMDNQQDKNCSQQQYYMRQFAEIFARIRQWNFQNNSREDKIIILSSDLDNLNSNYIIKKSMKQMSDLKCNDEQKINKDIQNQQLRVLKNYSRVKHTLLGKNEMVEKLQQEKMRLMYQYQNIQKIKNEYFENLCSKDNYIKQLKKTIDLMDEQRKKYCAQSNQKHITDQKSQRKIRDLNTQNLNLKTQLQIFKKQTQNSADLQEQFNEKQKQLDRLRASAQESQQYAQKLRGDLITAIQQLQQYKEVKRQLQIRIEQLQGDLSKQKIENKNKISQMKRIMEKQKKEAAKNQCKPQQSGQSKLQQIIDKYEQELINMRQQLLYQKHQINKLEYLHNPQNVNPFVSQQINRITMEDMLNGCGLSQISPQDIQSTNNQETLYDFVASEFNLFKPRLNQAKPNIQMQNFNNLIAQNYGINTCRAAQMQSFFKDGIIKRFQYKLKIVQQIQKMMQKRIVSTKLVFKYGSLASVKECIYEKDNLVCVLKTINNVHIATYYSGRYTKFSHMTLPALIFALTNNHVIDRLPNPTNLKIPFRSMIYHDIDLIWGNEEVKIGTNDKTLSVKIGSKNPYFNSKELKANDLICEGQKTQVNYEGYEIYQVIFAKDSIIMNS